MTVAAAWTLRVTEDFAHPGWFYIPQGMTEGQRQEWIAEALESLQPLLGVEGWDGTPTTNAHLRHLLERGLDDESTVEALATFQVWPLPGPAVVTCRVSVVPTTVVPDWSEPTEGAVHPIDGAHIGPGVQFSTRTTVVPDDADEGDPVDLYSLDVVFDDGEVAVVISLERSVAALVANAFPGLATLKDAIRVVRPDGSEFASVAPANIIDPSMWEVTGS